MVGSARKKKEQGWHAYERMQSKSKSARSSTIYINLKDIPAVQK